MRKSVIDVGTNSVLLLLADVHGNGDVKVLKQDFKISRLGAGLIEKGALTAHAMHRTVELIKSQVDMAKGFGCSDIRILATEAVRKAVNAQEFCSMLEAVVNIPLEIITAEQEAKLTYLGSVAGLDCSYYCVIDVGGGSTEIINGTANKIDKSISLPLGAVFLAEKFKKPPRIDKLLKDKVLAEINSVLDRATLLLLQNESCVIGFGGTMSTLAMIEQGVKKENYKTVHGYIMTVDKIWDLYHKINRLSLSGRVEKLAIEKGREMYILFGVLIIIALLQKMKKNEIIASDRGLRFGAVKTGLN